MQRGWRRILIAAVVLSGTAAALRAQQGHIAGPPAPSADEIGPAQTGAPEPASPLAQEAKSLGGTPADAAKFRGRFSPGGDGRTEPAPATPSLRAGEGWWRTAAALAVVVALIAAFGAGIRGWARRSGGLLQALGPGGRAPSGLLQVLGRYPAGRGQLLVLLKLDRRVLLVSQSAAARGAGMQTLCELTDPEEVASILMLTAEAEGRSLGAKFREMVSGFESTHDHAERAHAPAAVEIKCPEAAHGDPVGSLRSRLATLRGIERERLL